MRLLEINNNRYKVDDRLFTPIIYNFVYYSHLVLYSAYYNYNKLSSILHIQKA